MSLTRRSSNVRSLKQPQPKPPLVVGQSPDLGFILSLVALVSVGLIMIYSANAVGGAREEIIKLLIITGVGLGGLLVGAFIPVRWWKVLTPLFLLACIGALASLLVPSNPLAVTVNGATRWLQVGGGFVLQPSEFAKLAFILAAAQLLEPRGRLMKSRSWVILFGLFLLLAGLIYKEPDLGTALVLAGTAFCLLVSAGVNWRVLVTGVVVTGGLVFLIAWNTQHQKERLLVWRDPWAIEHRFEGGHQVIQSWSAMARGGLTGVGLGQSIQKLDNRLPESETDFIFAIVAEELGLIRAGGVLLLFGLFAWRGYAIAARAPDRYTGLIAAGITSWIAVQSCLNVAVVTGTVPNTGVPLPFISSGGSSLLALLLASGVVIGISRLRRAPAEQRESTPAPSPPPPAQRRSHQAQRRRTR